MKKEIKFTVEESQEWDSDIRITGTTKHDGQTYDVALRGRVHELPKMKKRLAAALGRNITTLLEQEKRKKDIADIVGITYEEHDVIIEGK